MKKKVVLSVVGGLLLVSLIGLSACKGILRMPHAKLDFSNVKQVKICQSVSKFYTNPRTLINTEKQYIINYLHTEIQNNSPSAEELRSKLTELGMQCNQDSCSVDCGYIVRELYSSNKERISTEHFPIKIYLNLQQGLNSLNPYWQQ